MTQQHSFTHAENELLPKFRKRINEAESTEDVKKAFVYSMQDLFKTVSEGRLDLRAEDVGLNPEKDSFLLSDGLQSHDDFAKVWNDTDLPRIVARFTELALHQYTHLAKNPAKTEAKIRM